jgi:hypothetical protein
LTNLFGLSQAEPEDGEDREAGEEWRETKAKITGALNRFLDTLEGLDANERYDAIVDEIDKFAEDTDVSFLWNLVRLVYRDDDYAGNKRRVLRHLCRKLGLDSTVLPTLENAVKTLAGVKKEREDLTASDRPYREVAAALAVTSSRLAMVEALGYFPALMRESTVVMNIPSLTLPKINLLTPFMAS